MSVDYAKDLILVTGASGKQGTRLLPFLVPKWKNIRLAVSTESSRDRMKKAYPDAEIVQVNLAEPTECHQLLNGVTALYHMGPPMHLHEIAMGYNMIDAAIAQGGSFKHFVYSSVLNTQIRKMFNHDGKRYVVCRLSPACICFRQFLVIADCRSATYSQYFRKST